MFRTRDGKTVREDHEKLKIDSIERLTCCYAHSAEMPTFHRRIYWLLPIAAGSPGGGSGGESATPATGDNVSDTSEDPVSGEKAPAAPGASGRAVHSDSCNLVLVHYLDER